jgi:hypothetical protein
LFLPRFDFYTSLISITDILGSSFRELPFISRLTKRVLLGNPGWLMHFTPVVGYGRFHTQIVLARDWVGFGSYIRRCGRSIRHSLGCWEFCCCFLFLSAHVWTIFCTFVFSSFLLRSNTHIRYLAWRENTQPLARRASGYNRKGPPSSDENQYHFTYLNWALQVRIVASRWLKLYGI